MNPASLLQDNLNPQIPFTITAHMDQLSSNVSLSPSSVTIKITFIFWLKDGYYCNANGSASLMFNV